MVEEEETKLTLTMTMVAKDINTSPMGVTVNILEVLAVGLFSYVILETESTDCGALRAVLMFYAFFYAYDLAVSLIVLAFGYKFGIRYIMTLMSIIGILNLVTAIALCLANSPDSCGSLLYFTVVGAICFKVTVDCCVPTLMLSPEDKKIVMERMGVKLSAEEEQSQSPDVVPPNID
jgi:hypothetical protein